MTDRPSAAAHNRWWRDRGFQATGVPPKSPGMIYPEELTLYVPYDERRKYIPDDVIDVDGGRYVVVGVGYEPEHDRAVVTAIEAGYLERYHRGENV